MTAEDFARLLRARKVGRGRWAAKCPAHMTRYIVEGSGVSSARQAYTPKGAANMTLPNSEYFEIPLSQGKVAIIDQDDYVLVSQYKWHVVWSSCNSAFYAENWMYIPAKRRELMHRLLLKCENGDGRQVDHINGNTLDNRRCNLRFVNHSQNQMNRKVASKTLSGHRGVSFCAKTWKWKARINLNGKEIWLGRYDSLEAAVEAVSMARVEYYGEYARNCDC